MKKVKCMLGLLCISKEEYKLAMMWAVKNGNGESPGWAETQQYIDLSGLKEELTTIIKVKPFVRRWDEVVVFQCPGRDLGVAVGTVMKNTDGEEVSRMFLEWPVWVEEDTELHNTLHWEHSP